MVIAKNVTLIERAVAAIWIAGLAIAVIALLWHHPWTVLAIVLVSTLLGLVPGMWRRQAEPPPPAADDLERRRPVWSVLSELFLDTELDESDYTRICAVLAKSEYNVPQLEEILYRELHPVLFGNLLNVAGEWAGFDENWLEQSILNLKLRTRTWAIVPWKWMVRAGWIELMRKLEETNQ